MQTKADFHFPSCDICMIACCLPFVNFHHLFSLFYIRIFHTFRFLFAQIGRTAGKNRLKFDVGISKSFTFSPGQCYNALYEYCIIRWIPTTRITMTDKEDTA